MKSPAISKFLLGVFVLIVSIASNAQYPMSERWDHHKLTDSTLGDIHFHLYSKPSNEDKPLLVYLDGSGNYPLFYYNKDGNLGTTMTLDFDEFGKDFHIVTISKPGIPFEENLIYDEQGRSYFPMNETYLRKYSLDWRVKSCSLVIDFLVRKLNVSDKVIIMGHSEGGQVAPAVAVENERVTHLICMMNNGLNHFLDFIMNERLRAKNGEISTYQAQINVDSLFAQYESMQSNAKEINRYWYGETYLKWSSYTRTSPLESMKKLDIPILYIGGGNDSNQPIFGMDYVRLEFIRLKKDNLTYKVFPYLDHYFQEEKVSQTGEVTFEDHIKEVHRFALSWVI